MRRRPFMTRESYLPQEMRGVAAYVPEGSDVSVWGWESGGKLYGIAFAGKADRPSFHYRFRTLEDRQASVDRLVASRDGRTKLIAARKAARAAYRHTVKVGDVFKASWGYEQTNVDFFECVATRGEKMIVVRPIGSRVTKDEAAYMTDYVMACPGEYIGEAKVVRVHDGNCFDLTSYKTAFPWSGQPARRSHYG